MNLENVALVRVMSHLPLNGEIIPPCEGQRLEYEKASEFQSYIRKKVQMELEQQLGRSLVLYVDSPDDILLKEKMKEYLVLNGAFYTSTLSFALNGIVPDDNTCEFSKQPLAVIDPIKNHTDKRFINIEAIDTTIVGKINVSKDAILVINADYYQSLSDEEKLNLISNYKIELFNGNLSNAIDATLKKYNYPSLPLKPKNDMQNIDECPERESMIDFMDKFAESVTASRLTQQKIRQLVSFNNNGDKIANEVLVGDFYKNLRVEEYYKHQLYQFLIDKAESFGITVTDDEKFYIFTSYSNGEEAMERITGELIKAYGGIEGFKSFIKEYNDYCVNNYLTNEEIVSLNGEGRKQ